jgi:hypothetical protein
VLGTTAFSKNPNEDSLNRVFVLRGDHVITNDNERIVEVDTVTKKPFMRVLGSLPKGYVVGGGVEHGAGFDLVAWDCTNREMLSCTTDSKASIVHVEGKLTETIPTPTTGILTLLPVHGTARVLRSDHALYRQSSNTFEPLAHATGKTVLEAAVSRDGTSAVVTEEGVTVRTRALR